MVLGGVGLCWPPAAKRTSLQGETVQLTVGTCPPPTARRVLQENDVVSLGGCAHAGAAAAGAAVTTAATAALAPGARRLPASERLRALNPASPLPTPCRPSTISLRGVPRPNPWVWRVRCLHEFLASYVPPSQGLPPAAAAGLAPLAAAPPAGPPPPREMYSFSPKPAVAVAAAGALPPGTILPAALPEEQPAAEEAEEPEEPAAEEEGEEEEAVEDEDEVPSSPGVPAATGSCPPGSMPVGSPAAAMLAPVAAPAPAKAAAEAAAGAHLEGTDLLPEDSEEAAQLAALEALEASQLAMGAAPRASPQEHQQPMQQPGPAAQQGPQQGQQQGQQLQGRRPPQLMVPRRAEPEVVDLTADSPSPTSPQRRRALVPPARLGGGRAGTAAGAAAAAGAGGADVVDLLADVSPTKRPHGTQDEASRRGVAFTCRPFAQTSLWMASSAALSRNRRINTCPPALPPAAAAGGSGRQAGAAQPRGAPAAAPRRRRGGSSAGARGGGCWGGGGGRRRAPGRAARVGAGVRHLPGGWACGLRAGCWLAGWLAGAPPPARGMRAVTRGGCCPRGGHARCDPPPTQELPVVTHSMVPWCAAGCVC